MATPAKASDKIDSLVLYLREFKPRYKEELKLTATNLLFIGWKGCGKSSLINLFLSALHESKIVRLAAPSSSALEHGTTRFNRHVPLDPCPVAFWDAWGIAASNYSSELTIMLKGMLPQGWIMDTDTTSLQRENKGLPTYMHGVVFVVAAQHFTSQQSLDNVPDLVRTRELMKKVKAAGDTYDPITSIPWIIVLTQCDKLDTSLVQNPSKLYSSAEVAKARDLCSAFFTLEKSLVFPVINYFNEDKKNSVLEDFGRRALKRILELADDRFHTEYHSLLQAGKISPEPASPAPPSPAPATPASSAPKIRHIIPYIGK